MLQMRLGNLFNVSGGNSVTSDFLESLGEESSSPQLSAFFNRQIFCGEIANPDYGFEIGETVKISYWDDEGEIIENLETCKLTPL